MAIYRIFSLANMKSDSHVHVQIFSSPESVILSKFLKEDVSYYHVITDVYTRYASIIGKYENLKNDLIHMTRQAGDLTDDILYRIENTPSVNKTIHQDDYRSYYTDETKKLVTDSSKEIIEKYDYSF
jgi:hypothetical protein